MPFVPQLDDPDLPQLKNDSSPGRTLPGRDGVGAGRDGSHGQASPSVGSASPSVAPRDSRRARKMSFAPSLDELDLPELKTDPNADPVLPLRDEEFGADVFAFDNLPETFGGLGEDAEADRQTMVHHSRRPRAQGHEPDEQAADFFSQGPGEPRRHPRSGLPHPRSMEQSVGARAGSGAAALDGAHPASGDVDIGLPLPSLQSVPPVDDLPLATNRQGTVPHDDARESGPDASTNLFDRKALHAAASSMRQGGAAASARSGRPSPSTSADASPPPSPRTREDAAKDALEAKEKRARRRKAGRMVGLVVVLVSVLAGAALHVTPHGMFGRYAFERFMPDAQDSPRIRAALNEAHKAVAYDDAAFMGQSLRTLASLRRDAGLHRALLAHSLYLESYAALRYGDRTGNESRARVLYDRLEARDFFAPDVAAALAMYATLRAVTGEDAATRASALQTARERLQAPVPHRSWWLAGEDVADEALLGPKHAASMKALAAGWHALVAGSPGRAIPAFADAEEVFPRAAKWGQLRALLRQRSWQEARLVAHALVMNQGSARALDGDKSGASRGDARPSADEKARRGAANEAGSESNAPQGGVHVDGLVVSAFLAHRLSTETPSEQTKRTPSLSVDRWMDALAGELEGQPWPLTALVDLVQRSKSGSEIAVEGELSADPNAVDGRQQATGDDVNRPAEEIRQASANKAANQEANRPAGATARIADSADGVTDAKPASDSPRQPRSNKLMSRTSMSKSGNRKVASTATGRRHDAHGNGWWVLGQWHLAQGDARQAVMDFAQSHQVQPSEAALLGMGEAKLAMQHPQEALDAFEAVEAMQPSLRSWHLSEDAVALRRGATLGKAEALLELGRHARALQTLQGLVQGSGKDAGKTAQQDARGNGDKGDKGAPQQGSRSVNASGPPDPRYLTLLARAKEASGDDEGAEAHFRDAIEAAPTSIEAYILLARLLEKGDRADSAKRVLDKAKERVRKDAKTYRLLATMELKRGDATAALQEYRSALALDPTDKASWLGFAQAARRQGKLEEAAQALVKLAELDATYAGLALEQGQLWEAQGKTEEALSRYDTSLRYRPDDPEVLQRLIATRIALERMEGLQPLIDRLAALRPSSVDLFYLRGRVSFHSGRFREAEAAFRQAVEGSARNEQFLGYLGWAQLELGDVGACLTTVKQVLELDPGSAFGHWLHGRLHLRTGKVADAKASLERSLNIDPAWSYAYADLAEAFDQLGRRGDAVKAYEKAVARRPSEGAWWYHLGRLRMDREQVQDGRVALQKAVDIGRTHPSMEAGAAKGVDAPLWLADAHRLLGEFYRIAKRPREALPHYRTYLAIAPPNALDRKDVESRVVQAQESDLY